ncbi:AbrB/MazE/SpoVT family DNA-binding domain-containing protein [Companilactobacillus zhongbaensis]|uniref:AbrB/MazE/SpoVT family DNA-binding domain-containing protein n=1 Tax=Companilactobacillus zhongbaensis TaxID=2486009 RepID=UPI001CDD28A9|nr:AbrB/MazE/SpoVT family DNA-binding domain-containing protein [Companilactobacillus zhongbaensis]
MDNNKGIVKISQNGEIKLSKELMKKLAIKPGDNLYYNIEKDHKVTFQNPNDSWYNIIKNTSSEKVVFDQNGNYDPKKSPNFHDWMVNG